MSAKWDPLQRARFRTGELPGRVTIHMLLLLLFVVGPIADLVLLIRFGQAFGFLTALEVVLGTAILGAWVVKAQGVRAAAQVRGELAAGRPPGRVMLDGLAILMGGVLLILPGLITDAFGLALLFPPTRYLLQVATRRWLERQLKAGTLRVSFLRWGEPGSPPVRPDAPLGLDPRNEILVPPPKGGGDPTLP